MSYRAVYRDSQGRTYSAPVELHDGKWVMVTSEGFAQINLHFDDDRAGRLEFVEYRDEPDDERLHIEPKQPGQSSLAQLQAAAAKQAAQALADRQHRRQDILNGSAKRDATKVAEARANATALAQRWNPKRPEPIAPIQVTDDIMALAEHARWKRKIEQQ